MRISEALSGESPLAVHFPGGAVLNIVYRPAAYTVAELEEIQAEKNNVGRILDAIRRIVKSWDLTDDAGNAVPLEKPRMATLVVTDMESGEVTRSDPPDDPLRHIPTPIYKEILRAVNDDQDPGEA
jgi:hypothetical protein